MLEHVKTQIEQGFQKLGLPDYMMGGVTRWVFDGIPPGSFLEAVFTNNLSKAVFCADRNNKQKLAEWAEFSYWYLPAMCRGNDKNVKNWKGLNNERNS